MENPQFQKVGVMFSHQNFSASLYARKVAVQNKSVIQAPAREALGRYTVRADTTNPGRPSLIETGRISTLPAACKYLSHHWMGFGGQTGGIPQQENL